MKSNRLALMLVICSLDAAVFKLPAQQTTVTTNGYDADLKAKAEKGDVEAQKQLAFSLEIPPNFNYDEGVKWYRKAAENGDVAAEWNLGNHYKLGQGVPFDLSEAAKWYRTATEQGYAPAYFSLGHLYDYSVDNGIFHLPPTTSDEPVKWYLKAAVRGDQNAQYRLGELYQNGEIVSVNKVEAYKWFLLADNHRPFFICFSRKTEKTDPTVTKKELGNRIFDLEQELSPSERADGQRRAQEFRLSQGKPDFNSGPPIATDTPKATGTAFFITDDGYLISNYHVVKDATKVRLLTSAGLIEAKVVQVDAANDLALLKADGRFASLPIAASRTVNLGGTVATVGFPNIGMQGFSPKLAKGEIASLSGAGDDPRYFQISVPVQPGNSGGALVDERGNVIGIVSAKLSARAALAETGALPENVNYAVKSSFLLGFLESVPAVSAKLKAPMVADRKFEDVVKSAQDAAVLVLVY
jgi:S1-C subfamily serine protease